MRRRTRRSKNAKKMGLITLNLMVLLILVSFFYFFKNYHVKNNTKVVANVNVEKKQNKATKTPDAIPESILNSSNEISDSEDKDIRKFPYPFSAMLAICSDIDDATLEEFKTYHKFLNTKETTPYGEGIGLDIGDSLWMYMADTVKYTVDKNGGGVENIMTFFKGVDSTQKHNADEVAHYAKVGWIDCLHTFGDFSTETERGTTFNRSLAETSWDTLNSINFKPTVWINHGNKSNKQNFGAHGTSSFMNYQQGDNPKSPYHHTDITLENGVKYVWNSISDHNFGHEYPLYEISLRDDKKAWGFYRYTNNIVDNKIDWTWTPAHIHRQLTKENLDNLVSNKYYSIVGQHFGVTTEDLFTDENIKSLRLLKDYESNGKILVAKTSRLLNYANVHKYVKYNKVVDNGITYFNITCVDDPLFGKYIPTLDNIRGLTFYCDDPENTVILLNKTKINSDELKINPKDESGKSSISIKWFKQDYTDYTK